MGYFGGSVCRNRSRGSGIACLPTSHVPLFPQDATSLVPFFPQGATILLPLILQGATTHRPLIPQHTTSLLPLLPQHVANTTSRVVNFHPVRVNCAGDYLGGLPLRIW